MRKTSQDGGDSTSITSGIENEIKKPGAIKTKKNSIKRKVQSFSNESDDTVIEPLLQKDNEKADTSKQSAKNNLLSKANKTEATSQTGSDKDKLIPDYKLQNAALSNASDTSESILPASYMKDNSVSKFTSANAPSHNHMNTNVFSSHDSSKGFVTPKSQILVEIDGSKQIGHIPSPLIFTTAKIHTDGKTKHMEPVQVTPVPILSTIEVSVVKSGINKGEFSGHVSSNISTICTNIPNISTNITEQDQKSLFKIPNNTSEPPDGAAQKNCNTSDKSFKLSSIKKEPISNKCTLYNVKTDVQENNCTDIKGGCASKVATLQPTNSSASHKIPSIQSKTESVTVPHLVTKTTSSNNYTKDTGVLDQTGVITQDKTYTPRYQERKIELNKNVKQDRLDLQSIKTDNVNLQSDAENACNKTSKDNIITYSSSQLRHQNIGIESDNPISKLKSSYVSTSLSNDDKSLKKSDEYKKSSIILGNILSDKTKLSKASAKSVPVSTATTSTIKTSLVDNKTTTEAIIAANKSLVSINTSDSVSKISLPITTTIIANKTCSALASTAKIQSASKTVITTTSANISSVSVTTTATGNHFFATITATTVANKTTTPSTTIVAVNKPLAFLSTIAASNKTPAPINSTFAATNKISAPTSTITVVDKVSTSNFISLVNSNTQSTASNTIKPAIVTTTTGAGSIQSVPTNTKTMSQAASTIINTPSSSTVTSRSTKVSKVPTAIASFQPTTVVKSPILTTSKSHNIRTPTTVAISPVNSLKSSTSNPKASSGINNSINSATVSSASLTLAPSGSSSKSSAATNHNDTKND